MTAHAHLLLQTHVGCADDVAAFVGAAPSVTMAAVTSGAYDVIAVVDLTDDGLSRALTRARRAPGLQGLRVCRPADAAPPAVPSDDVRDRDAPYS